MVNFIFNIHNDEMIPAKISIIITNIIAEDAVINMPYRLS